jgi:hypothetical protein
MLHQLAIRVPCHAVKLTPQVKHHKDAEKSGDLQEALRFQLSTDLLILMRVLSESREPN